MTLARTLHRRAARKRAKLRPKSEGVPFRTAEWISRELLDALAERFSVPRVVNRQYSR